MKDMNARLLLLIALVLWAATLVSLAFADDTAIWPTYHYDIHRSGQNTNSKDIKSPNSPDTLNMIWVYPRLDGDGAQTDELRIVDNSASTHGGNWKRGTDDSAIQKDFLYSAVVATVAAGKTAPYVKWLFPGDKLTPGKYMVYVWVPASGTGTTAPLSAQATNKATYTVSDVNGDRTIVFDQTQGGAWRALSTDYFTFTASGTGGGSGQGVAVSALVTDKTATGTIVLADAVKFVPATGQTIYSSPASADLDPVRLPEDITQTAIWNGPATCVFVNTMEPALSFIADGKTQTRDVGSICCIYGITPTLQNPALRDGTPDPNVPNSDLYVKISKYLGKTKWQYPNPDPTKRQPLEGPIDGGMYSSPTLAKIPDGQKTQLACLVTGGDRQVYCLKANTGELLWKGPGITVPEENATFTGAWKPVTNRADAFGGSFRYLECVDTANAATADTCTWNFSSDDRLLGRPDNTEGLAYAIYAWLPGPGGTGDKQRSMTAIYEITYEDKNGAQITTPVTVQVDQSIIKNQGTWVRIGSSYFNPSKVVLKNTATPVKPPATGANAASTNGIVNPLAVGPSDYAVVADAVMFVPDTVEGLGYNSPVTDEEKLTSGAGTAVAKHVYAMTVNGRAMAFDVETKDKSKAIGKLTWMYPSVRTKRAPGASDVDQPDWGDIGASPAYSLGRLYVSTLNGTVRCIDNANTATPAEKWSFKIDPNTDEVMEGFTSSPCLDPDDNKLFIGAISGIFYCLDTLTGAVRWQYPAKNSNAGSDGIPTVAPALEKFMYSTPAVGIATDSGGAKRVWCAGSGGHIYSFLAADGERLWLDDSGNKRNASGPFYSEPWLQNAVNGSVVLDGASISGNSSMYVGDMSGILHWRDADNGTTDAWTSEGYPTVGMLFSTPSITNTTVNTTPVSWVYVGCGDGHLLAFTRQGGGWGGIWQGGDWPFPGSQWDQTAIKTQAAPETSIQFDIFNDQFFQASRNLNPEPVLTDSNTKTILDNWDTGALTRDTIVSKDMKILTGTYTSDAALDKALIDNAKTRRQWAYLADHNGRETETTSPATLRDPVDKNNNLFFEWGETINVGIWNLPETQFLYGGTNAISITMTNASAGSSAGSSYKATVQAPKDYTVVKPTATDYVACTYKDSGNAVRRSYALATIKLDGTSTNPPPPTPGPGWTMSLTVQKKSSNADNAPVVTTTVPLAKLTLVAGSNPHYDPKMKKVSDPSKPAIASPDQVSEASLGINNPIGIRDDAQSPTLIAWKGTSGPGGSSPDRTAPDAHLNGNYAWSAAAVTKDNPSGFNYVPINSPTLYMDLVSHGTSSREASLGIVDRSAEGFYGQEIKTFKIDSADLRFRDWPKAVERDASGAEIGFKFPWDYGQSSIDYPDIYTRYQTYQQLSSDRDISANPSSMLGVVRVDPGGGATAVYPTDARLQPDTVLVSVDVPRFQPANVYGDGYTKTMIAYIDSNGNKTFDSGNYTRGPATTYQEAYRRFKVAVKVPPDPKIEVDEQLIDIGSAPHGLGDQTIHDLAFSAYNTNPEIQQWFKKLTIKNAGNVNLYNIRIDQALGLFGDQASLAEVLPGLAITSSLDPAPMSAFGDFGAEPFVSWGPNCDGMNTYLGYALSKPRVGDPDPTVMTIPDRRKWDVDYTACRVPALSTMDRFGWLNSAPEDATPMPVKVSVRVPLTQPIGTYQSVDYSNGVPYVAVFSDILNRNGDPTKPPVGPQAGDAVAMPSFQLKLAVRENQLTGGATKTTLPQVDFLTTGGAPPELLPKVGDATPAAFRDAADDKLGVHLFWSSNRLNDGTLSGGINPDKFASAPWFINHASLAYDVSAKNWKTTDALHWWNTPNLRMPNAQWAVPSGKTLQALNILPWNGVGATGSPGAGGAPTSAGPAGAGGTGGTGGLYSVKHYSPCIGENLAVSRSADANRTWLAWAGIADTRDPATNKLDQANMIFYTDVTHGSDSAGASRQVWAIEHDSTMAKRFPCPLPDGDNMWMFWQGGMSGNWSIYYSWCDGGPTFDTTNASHPWSPDLRLRTPDCMASVGSPNPMLRHLWANTRDVNERDFPDAYRDVLSNSKKLLDVVYAGTNKLTHNADIILSRYLAATPNDAAKIQPSRVAQPLARSFDEKLMRDSKFGFYTSKNLAWIRPGRGKPAGLDHWGQYASDDPNLYIGVNLNPAYVSPDYPYIHVVFPEGYADTSNGITLDPFTEISATDGSVVVRNPVTGAVTSVEGPVTQAPGYTKTGIVPEIDDATGIYTYSYARQPGYSGASIADKVLGQMLVDYSSGIVRFTKPIKEDQLANGKYRSAEVHADYTPQAWRITTDAAADGSPRAFIEHTSMMGKGSAGKIVNGLDPSWDNGQPAPVDRMWVFWRKTGTSSDSSTISYTTMRIGVDLTKLGLKPIPMNPASGTIGSKTVPNAKLVINNARGPWEVDRTGTKIYFSEVDERYRSMFTNDNYAALGAPSTAVGYQTSYPDAKPISISYIDMNGNPVGSASDPVPLDDVSWITELPEQSMAFATDTNVNEGSIYAFADPQPDESGTSVRVLASKIWVFWTSTRGGNSDLFWETLCPNFWAR